MNNEIFLELFNKSIGQKYSNDNGPLLFDGYPRELLDFAGVCCGIFMLIGIPGNLITIIALIRYKKSNNATATLIINLAISDLIFCCFVLPLAASMFLYKRWIFADTLCQFFPLMRYGLVAVSLLSILAITVNRYIMIARPNLYVKIYTKNYLYIMIIFIWLIGFGSLVATWLGYWGRFGLDEKIGSCSILPDKTGHSPKQFLFVAAFIIPCLCIIVCYVRIYFIVRNQRLKTRFNKLGVSSQTINKIQPQREEIIKPSTNKESFKYISESKLELNRLGVNMSPSTNELDITTPLSVHKCLKINGRLMRSDTNLFKIKPKFLRSTSSDAKFVSRQHSLDSNSTIDNCQNKINNFDKLKATNECNVPIVTKSYTSTKEKLKRIHNSSEQLKNKFKTNEMMKRKSLPSIDCHLVKKSTNSLVANGPKKMSSKDKRIFKMIAVIFVAYVACYLPITLSKILFLKSKYLSIISYICIYLTPCINPLIYVVMSSEYRQAYISLLSCSNNNFDFGKSRSRSS